MNFLEALFALLRRLFGKVQSVPPPDAAAEPVTNKLTASQLSLATGSRIDLATKWLPFLVAAMDEFDINTPARQSMFLSQIGHESGSLRYSSEIWGPSEAQKRYEGRVDLGNIETGDGSRFRGRGLLQITGRGNYTETGKALGVDLLSDPELLGLPELAARSAAWWWMAHGLNGIADTGDNLKATQRINGGTNGLTDRMARYEAAKRVFA